ncbi:MAG: sigma-54 dependent transcriptional regulator [candidate division Zixibacteria bacterium]|nr:sigma-54 dependent transcriptional regulator [candidate division Zixibacteria bacterium]
MNSLLQVAVLADRDSFDRSGIKWERLGTLAAELAEIYQLVKEQKIDLIIVGRNRHEVTPSVALRLRRHNGLTEIWQVSDVERVDPPYPHFDGSISVDLDQKGLADKIKQILADGELLKSYGIVSRSPLMKVLARTISRVAPSDISVLIVGPSGSGKELVAKALHADSTRSKNPFVAINCGALAEGILESELFGHEKGAFTGSVGKRDGLFHKAEGGTIFLDEIGETKPDMQVKLLRVLEDGAYYPVGSSSPKRANVRVVAATNRDLTEAISERQFREDLYFRIGVVKIILPPLLNRKQDIQPLLEYFWRDEPDLQCAESALELLGRYDWPGNIRQLKNFALRMAALKPPGLVRAEDVERFLDEQRSTSTHLPVATGRTVEAAGQELMYRAILSLGNEVRTLRDLITSNLPSQNSGYNNHATGMSVETTSTMDGMEKTLIAKSLAETNGNRKEAARRLGIGERTLYRKLTKYNLS